MKVILKFPGKDPVTANPKQWSTIEEIIAPYVAEAKYPIYLASIDNATVDLNLKIGRSGTITLLDMRTQAANMTYQASLTMLYLSAVREVLGDVPCEIDHSLNKGLLTKLTLKKPITENQIKRIDKAMRRMVKEDAPIRYDTVSRTVALARLDDAGHVEKKRLLERAKDIKKVRFYTLGTMSDFHYGSMVPSAGYLQYFEVRHYRKNEVLLRFPLPSNPVVVPPYVDDTLLYDAFTTARHWQDLLELDYVNDLNDAITAGRMPHIMQLSEALHQKHIVDITEEIVRRKKRIILIAGPSCSGKTTFARRLCIQLEVAGLKPLYMGTDDYFVDRKDTPVNELGEPDYENLNAVDLDLFNEQLTGLLKGETVDIPVFDFLKGKKIFGKHITTLGAGQPIVIEGIHALNNLLTGRIPSIEKYKIYISPLTQLNIDEHNRVPTTDARLLRRIVRDNRYRGYSAAETIDNWPKVRAGEEKNIFPFNGEADIFFNSVHVYELAVLKKFAQPLLARIKRTDPAYGEAVRLRRLLAFVNSYGRDDLVAGDSILREFIGGSVFLAK